MLLHQLFGWTASLFSLQFLVASERLPTDLRCRAPGCSSHTRPAALIQTASWGERMFTMLRSCLLPSLSATASDQRHKKRGDLWGRECCISFHPSLPLSLALLTFEPVFPSSPRAFIFLVFACPLRAKGLSCSAFLCVCVCACAQAISGWCITHWIFLFSSHGPSQCSTF